MPKEQYFSKALYTFDIGQNDLGVAFFLNKSVKEVNASVPDIVRKFSANIKVKKFQMLLIIILFCIKRGKLSCVEAGYIQLGRSIILDTQYRTNWVPALYFDVFFLTKRRCRLCKDLQ